jgi:dTDP-glucose 4,6-dehydratase
MRVLVTGAAGFLGSHLCDHLLGRGHEVLALDDLSTGSWDNLPERPALTRITADAADPPRLDGPLERVYHLASPASPTDFARMALQVMRANAIGTWRMLELAEQKGARLLLASTSEVYGDPLVSPQPESYWGNVNPVGPRSCYDESKRFAEALATAYAGRVECRIVRFFNTYGPRMRPDDGRAVPTFLVQALRGAPMTVHGDGAQTRSFAFVADVVPAVAALMESDAQGPVNLGSDNEVPLLELARRVRKLVGSRSEIVHVPGTPDDPQRRRPDLTRVRQILGFTASTSLDEGLARTADWFRSRATA